MADISKEQVIQLARTVHGWMSLQDLRYIYDIASGIPQEGIYVEIGVWKGRSLLAAGLALPIGCKLVAIDNFEGVGGTPTNEVKFASDFVRYNAEAAVKFISQRSPISVDFLQGSSADHEDRFGDETVDVAFIDACHTENAVTIDLNTWWPKIKKGGIMFGHDFASGQKGVVRAVKRFAKRNNLRITRVRKSTLWQFEKSFRRPEE